MPVHSADVCSNHSAKGSGTQKPIKILSSRGGEIDLGIGQVQAK